MTLKKIHIDIIGKTLETVIKSFPLFSTYSLSEKRIQDVNTPTKITNYDFVFTSEEYNRWLFIRLQDFFSHQNLVVWLNELKYKKNVNIDIKNYFILELKNNAIKQKMVFKIKSEKDLEPELKDCFLFIDEQMDDKLKKAFLGELWINMSFDWGNYK